MRKFIRDVNAATPTYEYIILIGIIVVYLAIFFALYSNEFEIAPSRVAMQTQFEDVGNGISSKIVDMYVTKPETGYLKTKFYMPQAVGKYEYKVEFKEEGLDQHILVSAIRFEKEVMINLNKIGSSLDLRGSTYSASPEHWLAYRYASQKEVTAVAMAFPKGVPYNVTTGLSDIITFDGSGSRGVGKLKYNWEFGDGTTSNNAIEYHQYSSEGIKNVKLTVYDPILDMSANSTVQVNVTMLNIPPVLDTYKYVSPKSVVVGEQTIINIVLFGRGTPQNGSSLDVVLTTDTTGSMDSYTPLNKTRGVIQSLNWSETIVVDNSFKNMSIMAKSVNGTPNKDIDLWIKYPNGTTVRANIAIPDGEQFIQTNPAIGNWNLIVTGNFTNGTQNFKVIVNKSTTGPGSAADILVAEYSGTISSNAYVKNITAEDKLSRFSVELVNINGTKKLYMWTYKNGVYQSQGNYTEGSLPVSAGTNYTVYVTGAFPEGSQEFELTSYVSKLDGAKITGKSFTDDLKSNDTCALVTFNATDKSTPTVRIIQGLTYNKTAVKNAFDGLSAGGYTPTAAGIEASRNELIAKSLYFTANDSTRTPVIILLTDGLPNVPEPDSNAIAQALSQANTTKAQGILIYTIGFGLDVNMSLLANISSGKGYYFFAATKEELQAIYSQIAKELWDIAAKNVVVTDVVPAGIDVLSAPGAVSITKNADGTTTIVWKMSSIKIYSYGQTPEFLQVGVSSLNTGSMDGNVFSLSNATYNNVVTGNSTKLVFPQTNVTVSSTGEWLMNLE